MDAPTLVDIAIMFFAGIAAGGMNALAGGGTIVSFPVLLWLGIGPIHANATSAVGLWPGGLGAVWGFRREMKRMHYSWLWYAVPSLAGGLLGAILLVQTPSALFLKIAPYLVLVSTLLIAAEPSIRKQLPAGESKSVHSPAIVGSAGILLISMYGGYFGAGLGILLLSVLALTGISELRVANALKNWLGVFIKGIAVTYFIASGAVIWTAAVATGAGALLGGYAAGAIGHRMKESAMRGTIVIIGLLIAALLLADLMIG